MTAAVESMLYVGETPWHKLGVKLDAPPTSEEAIKAAGLDWKVGLKDLMTVDGTPVDHRASYRESDGSILGVVGPGWHPIQNADAFKWFDPFLQSGEASIETAGSLQEGRRVFVLARLNRSPSRIVEGDDVLKYILLANGHDGTLAGRVGFTPIRVVCQNTLSMAMGNAASKLLKVRHTKNAVDTMNAIRDTMNAADASFEATAEQYRQLARRQVAPGDLEKYVKLVFPAVKLAPVPSQDQVDAAVKESKNVELIRQLFETGVGSQLPGVRGTYWGAYNAITEFTTHLRGRNEENRLAAQFADGAAINQRALTEAIKLAS